MASGDERWEQTPNPEEEEAKKDKLAGTLLQKMEGADLGSEALEKIRKLVEGMDLTPEQADDLIQRMARVAALQWMCNKEAEEVSLLKDSARLNRSKIVIPDAATMAHLNNSNHYIGQSKLARKLQRSRGKR